MKGKANLIHPLENHWIFSYIVKIGGDSRIVRVPLVFHPSLTDGKEIEVTLERDGEVEIARLMLKQDS
jgi:hypothetical protein